MKQFEIPNFYKSSIIGELKNRRKEEDPKKKDFSPSELTFGSTTFVIARHFGFCYGVENAIEISYRALEEHPDKRIFLLSQMIHNPDVNKDLEERGMRFVMDTHGNALIDWNELTSDDIVITPAFGTTVEIEENLKAKGIELQTYDTTCPFVTRVWKKAEKLSSDGYAVVIHGKEKHEETRATFSHSDAHTPSLIIRDLDEAEILAQFIRGTRPIDDFKRLFEGRFSTNFDPAVHLHRLGVVNQTTMLATETQEIAEHIKNAIIEKYGEENYRNHFADTRDTLCYATNDNQQSTLALAQESADFAIVVGGYNSSNTSHLVELLEAHFKTYFIKNESELINASTVHHFNLHTQEVSRSSSFLDAYSEKPVRIVLTSGASCPDAIVDRVIKRILELRGEDVLGYNLP